MSDNIGGSGTLAVLYGPALVGGAAGALIVKKHRVIGGVGGVILGGLATFLYARSQQKPVLLLPRTTLNTGATYVLALPAGGDASVTASADGFTNVTRASDGQVTGTWAGANNTATPANILASS